MVPPATPCPPAMMLDTTDAPSPADVIARWSADLPLVGLVAHGAIATAGWSLLASPARWRVADPGALGRGDEAVRGLRAMLTPPSPLAASPPDPGGCPFAPGGWIACLAYELGRSLEPEMARPAGPLDPEPAILGVASAIDDRHWPDVLLARVDGGLAYEHARGRWWWFGTAPRETKAAIVAMLERSAAPPAIPPSPPVAIGALETRSLDDAAHEAAVAAAHRAIASGEIFQANITRRRTVDFEGSLRTLALAAFDVARPKFGALLEAPGGRGVVSVSPELFLDVTAARGEDGDPPLRTVRTRPIKGTAPAPGHADPDGAARLLASAKDAAELAMIVDLMRNDLGRVARPGTVRVSRPRTIETHATVHHALAEVSATLPADVDAAALLAATFPPGSVTGAPKIRAMQVIDRLEPVRRGPYCGAIGWIGDDGTMRLNVAIRTLAVSPPCPTTAEGRAPRPGPTENPKRPVPFVEIAASSTVGIRRGFLDYASGGGIVADSTPPDERREADLKAEVFRRTLARLEPSPATRKRPEPPAIATV